MTSTFKRVIVGKPIASSEEHHQRLGKPTALAVFASDALSSTAYASEEILRTLLLGVGGIAVPVCCGDRLGSRRAHGCGEPDVGVVAVMLAAAFGRIHDLRLGG